MNKSRKIKTKTIKSIIPANAPNGTAADLLKHEPRYGPVSEYTVLKIKSIYLLTDRHNYGKIKP